MPEQEIRTVKEYQNHMFNSLKRIFNENNVRKEWDVAKNSGDGFTRELYCPRLDIAVGPFHTSGNISNSNRRMTEEVSFYQGLLRELFANSEISSESYDEFINNRNQNPRCFLAVEIENSGSSKHMLGNIANVSILGAIGVVVPFNEDRLRLCKRIKKYVTFATEAEKIKDVFKNVLIVKKERFQDIVVRSARQCHN